jgi:hypothetical protein
MSFHSAFFTPILQTKMSEQINLSQFVSVPFNYSVGDTFKLPLTFSYDVTSVSFELKIYDAEGILVKTYTNTDWTLSGTNKKTLLKSYADLNLLAGTYRMILRHTFPDTTVKKRIDSPLNIKA